MKTKMLFYKNYFFLLSFVLFFNCSEEDKIEPIDNGFFNPDITYGTVSDIDLNNYKTVKIGTQTWMAENLKVCRFNNGVEIPNIKDNKEWINMKSGALCDYNNDSSFSKDFGKIYNGYAAKSEFICPEGWHIPSTEEWFILIDYCGGINEAGKKLKMKVKKYDDGYYFNIGGSNESGFTALAAGCRSIYEFHDTEAGSFYGRGLGATWWTSTEKDSINLGYINIEYSDDYVNSGFSTKPNGSSIRCIKD